MMVCGGKLLIFFLPYGLQGEKVGEERLLDYEKIEGVWSQVSIQSAILKEKLTGNRYTERRAGQRRVLKCE